MMREVVAARRLCTGAGMSDTEGGCDDRAGSGSSFALVAEEASFGSFAADGAFKPYESVEAKANALREEEAREAAAAKAARVEAEKEEARQRAMRREEHAGRLRCSRGSQNLAGRRGGSEWPSGPCSHKDTTRIIPSTLDTPSVACCRPHRAGRAAVAAGCARRPP